MKRKDLVLVALVGFFSGILGFSVCKVIEGNRAYAKTEARSVKREKSVNREEAKQQTKERTDNRKLITEKDKSPGNIILDADVGDVILNPPPATGNVGIGTTGPQNKLDVEGGMAVGASYSGTNSAPSNGMIIEGNVGIGTASPNARLHIRYPTNGLIFNAETGSGSSDLDIRYGYNGYGWYWKYFGSGSGDNNELQLWSEGAGSTDQQVYGIKQSGIITFHKNVYMNSNLGIGTSSPQNKLDVEGGMAVGASYSGTNSAPSNGMIIEGNVGIGTSSPDEKFEIEWVADGTDVEIGRGTTDTDITFITLRNENGTKCYIYPKATANRLIVTTTKP